MHGNVGLCDGDRYTDPQTNADSQCNGYRNGDSHDDCDLDCNADCIINADRISDASMCGAAGGRMSDTKRRSERSAVHQGYGAGYRQSAHLAVDEGLGNVQGGFR